MKIDFIIIGSGLSGLTSALVLEKYGRVLMVTKGKTFESSTDLAQGGVAAVLDKPDSYLYHIEDTMGREGAHTFRRILHAGDFTGREIEEKLIKSVKNKKNIEIWEDSFAFDLIVGGNKCHGVSVVRNNRVENIFSKAVVLATGGLGQLYKWTTNPIVATGDGVAMAVRAGCSISDLEFIQFHPTAFGDGSSPLFLLSEALRGEGAYLKKVKNQKSPYNPPAGGFTGQAKIKNENGERFIYEYDKRGELASRDIVARAIYEEQLRGFEVFLDIRHRGRSFIQRRFPNIYREVKKRGYDMAVDLIPVTPVAHYSCGGVKTDVYGRTSVENLFAFGETASSGVHGANRLASNSLLEAVVFPLQISGIANMFSGQIKSYDVPKKEIGNDQMSANCIRVLQEIMWENAGIIRNEKGLEEARRKIDKLEKELELEDKTSKMYMEYKNMLLVSKLIVKAALKRKKSLGAHFRKD